MKRLHHLDALRGLAALVVAFQHSLLPFPDIRRTGVVTLVTGETAVLFFFLLSGFVLSGSLQKITDPVIPRLSAYWIRRGFRLYPTVLAAVLFTIGVSAFYCNVPLGGDVPGVSPGILKQLREASLLARSGPWLQELTLRTTMLNPPLWTIRVELLCSFLLPVLVLTFRKYPSVILPLAVGLGFLCTRTSWDFRYMFQFCLGYIVWRERAIAARIPSGLAGCLMAGLLLLLLVCNGCRAGLVAQTIVLTALFFLLVPCRPNRLRNALERPWPSFLGRVSFSFYALHWPVLLLILSLMLTHAPDLLSRHQLSSSLILFLVSICVTAALARFCERWIEAWSNRLGGFLVDRLISGPGHSFSRKQAPRLRDV